MKSIEFSGENSENSQMRFQALHHQFVTSDKAVKLGYSINLDDMLLTQQTTQMTNMFCSNVQVRGYYPSYSKCYLDEHGIKIEELPEDKEILKKEQLIFIYLAITCLY